MMRSGMLGTRIVRSLGVVGLRRVVLGALASCLLLALGAAPAGAFEDFSGGARSTSSRPGAEGGISSGKYSTDQGKLYDSLTPHKGKVTQALIEKKYPVREIRCRRELRCAPKRLPAPAWKSSVTNTTFPHIYGTTRGAAMYGSGWVAAKDRGLLLKLGLGPAYAAALSIPGRQPVRAAAEQPLLQTERAGDRIRHQREENA